MATRKTKKKPAARKPAPFPGPAPLAAAAASVQLAAGAMSAIDAGATTAPRLLTMPDDSTEHPGLAYLFQFVRDHLPSLPPSSRDVTADECLKALKNVQGDLNDLTREVLALRAGAQARANAAAFDPASEL